MSASEALAVAGAPAARSSSSFSSATPLLSLTPQQALALAGAPSASSSAAAAAMAAADPPQRVQRTSLLSCTLAPLSWGEPSQRLRACRRAPLAALPQRGTPHLAALDMCREVGRAAVSIARNNGVGCPDAGIFSLLYSWGDHVTYNMSPASLLNMYCPEGVRVMHGATGISAVASAHLPAGAVLGYYIATVFPSDESSPFFVCSPYKAAASSRGIIFVGLPQGWASYIDGARGGDVANVQLSFGRDGFPTVRVVRPIAPCEALRLAYGVAYWAARGDSMELCRATLHSLRGGRVQEELASLQPQSLRARALRGALLVWTP